MGASLLLFPHSAVVPNSLPSGPNSADLTCRPPDGALNTNQSRALTLRLPGRFRTPDAGNSNHD